MVKEAAFDAVNGGSNPSRAVMHEERKANAYISMVVRSKAKSAKEIHIAFRAVPISERSKRVGQTI